MADGGAIVHEVKLPQATVTTAAEIRRVIAAVNVKKPKQEDIEALRRLMAQLPGLARALMDLTEVAEGQVLGEVHLDRCGTEAMKANLARLKDDLGYQTAPTLERLLIEQVALCWLRQNTAEMRLSRLRADTHPLSQGEYWDKRLSVAQSRYLRACETLARVRRLLRQPPAVQVNIAAQGGQQVNIAGDAGLGHPALPDVGTASSP